MPLSFLKSFVKEYLDSRDPDIWYDRGYNDGQGGKDRFELFFYKKGDNVNAFIKDAYDQGYDDGKNGNSYGRVSFYR